MLQNDDLRVVVLPELGAKIASCYYKPREFELAAQPNRPYRKACFNAEFSEYDASGFDDVFPSVIPWEQHCKEKTVIYPDHGEIWSANFSCTAEGDGLELSYESSNLPYRYSKRIGVEGNKLHIQSEITHTGGQPFPYLWLFHGLVRYEEDMRLIYPKGTRTMRNVLESELLGKAKAKLSRNNSQYSLDEVPSKVTKSMVKYYVDGPVAEGKCGYEYPQQGIRATIRFPHEELPYLGFWVTAGGYRGEYNCAFEPSNGFYDDIGIAKLNKALPVLHAGERKQFEISVELEPR